MSEFNLCDTIKERNTAEFIVDAVIFDMDGTLVDSIAAVESAWGAVAESLERDPQEVIDATHGRRAIDNLKDLKPHLRCMSNAEMEPHVQEFETEILRHADEYGNEVRSRRSSAASSKRASREGSRRGSRTESRVPSRQGSMSASMAERIDQTSSAPKRRSSLNQSITAEAVSSRMAALGLKPLTVASLALTPTSGTPPKSPTISLTDSGVDVSMDRKKSEPTSADVDEDIFDDDDSIHTDDSDIKIDTSDLTDKSVRILPGVRRFIDSLPEDRYCVATSGAKTYCYGALKRVGIVPPKVTITADDPRLKNGKPFPDPFLLAAKELGVDPKDCVVVEDSPSGIKAGVASGAKTIAVCTSHPHEKIAHCGAHWLIPTLDLLQTSVLPDGRTKIRIDATYEEVIAAHAQAVKSSIPPQLYLEQEMIRLEQNAVA